jgi:hypothetical protein
VLRFIAVSSLSLVPLMNQLRGGRQAKRWAERPERHGKAPRRQYCR